MKLDFISAKGEIMPLTGNPNFKLSNIDGLTVASVDISSSSVATIDGDFVNNMRTQPRGIVLDLAFEGADVEAKKRYVLKYVKPKQKVRLRMTQDYREAVIEGVVEEIDMPRFTRAAVMQITLYCSQPYWEDADYIVEEISETIDLHYFTDYTNDMLYFPEGGIVMGEYDSNRTKVFFNDGDVAVGMVIDIIALGAVKNPVIYDNASGRYIGVDIQLAEGDEVVISTVKGQKTIYCNGENIIDKIREGSAWLQLEVGENEFTIDSEDGTEGNMYFTLSYKQRYV